METLRLSLIGPGDIDFHFYNLLKISKGKFQSELKQIAKALAEAEVEIELLPDRGISLEIAKLYKSNNGKSVIASVPKSDTAYGIKHLEPYLNEKVNRKKLFDKEIDSGDWKQQNRLKALFGDVVLYLGSSLGSDLELNYAAYIFKLMKGFKEGLAAKYLHPEVRASKTIPYTILVYSPFFSSGKLQKETEAYMKKYGIRFEYIKNPKELKERLKSLSKLIPSAK